MKTVACFCLVLALSLRAAEPAAKPRVISPAVAAQLSAAAPKFAPPPAAPKEPNPVARTDLPASEKPKNAIIRLPAYVVQEPRVRVPTKERYVLTEKGQLDAAYRKHPGLRLGEFGPFKNTFWAAMLADEIFAAERSQEMMDLMSLLPGQRPSRAPMARGSTFHAPTAFSGPWAGLVVPWERK
jgi:hypothetical protein